MPSLFRNSRFRLRWMMFPARKERYQNRLNIVQEWGNDASVFV